MYKWKKIIAIMLAVLMAVNVVPVDAFATEADDVIFALEEEVDGAEKVEKIEEEKAAVVENENTNVLNQIDTEYVLFFLEDFFLLKKVRTDIFERALSLIESNPEIGLITFNKRRWGSSFPEETDYEKCFVELKKKVKNRTNVLVSLWRKEYFLII